jgi:SOS response regulatory protein OraA/RecX
VQSEKQSESEKNALWLCFSLFLYTLYFFTFSSEKTILHFLFTFFVSCSSQTPAEKAEEVIDNFMKEDYLKDKAYAEEYHG